MTTRADRALQHAINAAPAGSIHHRDMGGGKIEVVSIVRGSVTRLGTTKDDATIALAEKAAGTK